MIEKEKRKMLYSPCLLSRKGPLGVVWVAAYSHKRLKKAQVAETDISTSIEKILLDDFPQVACRVLGYLLLGVVRVYSKKVEYLFDDCHEVLIKINDFVGTKIVNAGGKALHAPFLSITLPDRFELDAFDLDITEEVSGDHVRPPEEIMLKDVWQNETSAYYSLDKYLYVEDAAETLSAAHTLAECALSPIAARLSNNLSNLEASLEKLRDERFSQEEDHEMFCGVGEEPLDPVRPFGEEHHTDGEQINFPEMIFSENAECQVIIEDQINVLSCHLMDNDVPGSSSHNLSSMEASMKKLQDNRFSQEEYFDREKADDQPPDLPRGEEPHSDGDQIKFSEIASSENRKHLVITEEHPVSVTLDATPESKFHAVSGATTPEFAVIPTPANKESARILRKRKCLVDELVVLPNKVVRQRIHNSGDLICKRRKVPHTALDAWKACRIPNLTQGFLEPLFPYSSLEIRSLFGKKQLKTAEPVEIGEDPHNLDVLVLPTVGWSSEQTALAVETTVDQSTPTRSDALGSPTAGRSSDQTAIAPGTPVDHSTSKRLREGLRDLDRWGSMSSFESIDRELSPTVDQDLDLNLMNEDLYSCEGISCEEDNGEQYGWSARTRAVAGYLHRSFLNRRKQKEEEIVSLFQVLKGRTEKESARLFYEILVLKSKGYFDVMQDNAYDDILVLDVPKS